MRRRSPRKSRVSKRTTFVWLSFAAATTLLLGVFALGEEDWNARRGGHLVAASVTSLTEAADTDPIAPVRAALDRQRWRSIVIHHLGEPAGDAESVHRMHVGFGYAGLGYHFLIGNGNGLGDGGIHVGYRWNEQLPGAHVARSAPDADEHNLHSIGICLIGNGSRRPFTDRQMRSLVALVRRLQLECAIPASRVYLHRDLAPNESSPGRFFASALLREQLID